LSEIADEVKTGAEKIITKNGESYVALVDAERLDYYHRLERERIHLLLLEEAGKGLADIAEGRVKDARKVIRRLRRISESA
jgi:antitoxin (DNA-binding transcriptional repressor) of toxin-antitoxin stability system